MEKKRTKLWRREQGFRVLKSRLKYYAAGMSVCIMDDGNYIYHPKWTDLQKCHWAKLYKTTGTPCSCWVCKGQRFNRLKYKREAIRIIDETMDCQ
jgi:hypothetical protein